MSDIVDITKNLPHKVITMDSFTISPSDSVIAWMPLPEPPKEDA